MLAFIGLFAFYCIRQRRAGRLERAVADANYEKDTAELMTYRATFGGKGYTELRSGN